MKWTDLLHELTATIFNGLGVALIILLPLFAIAWVAIRRKAQHKAKSLEPFTDLPLRPPGESLRLKIEALSEEMDTAFMSCFIAGMGSFCLVVASPPASQFAIGLGAGLFTFGVYIYSARIIFRTQKELWAHRLGFTGERVVGEQLNQLLAAGFQVFHDLPFDGYNIDHVIVGSAGVYALETKTRSKPADIKGQAKAKVFFDGTVLKFPRHEETEPIEQARLNAKTLSKWLSQATGEQTPVSAIVAIPGWWVERTGRGAVNVLNPKEIAGSFPSRPVAPLPADRIQRIVHQLTERCRMAKPS